MKNPDIPITDDHIHIDPRNGRGLAAARDFQRAGGTHLFLVSKPSSSFGIVPVTGEEFREVFDETIAVAGAVRELGLTVFVVLGVHPAEVTRLSAHSSLDDAIVVMKRGLDIAGEYIAEGSAVALKSGRPHYDVPPAILDASNEVLSHALSRASRLGCAVQIHAESGPCTDVVDRARRAGLPAYRVVKHYATPDTPLTPSMIATHPAIPGLAASGRQFTMESDYMDENSRPGAVIGPKSVPRATFRLISEGLITADDAHRIHSETPALVYGVEISR
ncbi:MAG: hydrolase TatD [Methanomicrobiales archaeon]|nr:hydrolase TatD [Methanomicrobiales archaeon]